MRIEQQQKKMAILAVGGILLFVLLWIVLRPSQETIHEEILFSTEETSTTVSSSQEHSEWFVDLKGAIQQPGMYRIKEGMRLMDVIELAGGFTDEADRNQVNLAKLLADQEIIYVPKNGEEIPVVQQATDKISDSPQSTTSDAAIEKININTADATQLQQLSGIGEKRAQDIIDYREENGSFQSVEDLMNVSGIGQKTLEKLRNSITI
ncbi:helix-hairpin-helix domain-containing protein [Candidatus Enterococcus ferrettii]|uniref:Competence protein ComEA n=1 Tax=Candidatus Enterococcus ferrettii TaxID=2815324 RepID=A0ABV0EQ03_9ENTE